MSWSGASSRGSAFRLNAKARARLTPCPNDHSKLPRAPIGRSLFCDWGSSADWLQRDEFRADCAFEAANIVAGERFYDLRILSERGEPLTNSLGWTMNTEPMDEGRFDTLMVGSGPDLVSPSPRTVAFLRDAISTTRRITSICHSGVHSGGSGNSGWPTRDHALVVRRRTWQAVPEG